MATFCYYGHMKIKSAIFMKGVTGEDAILTDGVPQIAFVGRSNVGKSSLINSFTGIKTLARTSSFPGRTQELNVFLINNKYYFIDLPGYGFAKTSKEGREKLGAMIEWYLFNESYTPHKVVLIVDANIGMTDNDVDMLRDLEAHNRDVIVVANKIDKVKKSVYKKQLDLIQYLAKGHLVIPYSSTDKIGAGPFGNALFA